MDQLRKQINETTDESFIDIRSETWLTDGETVEQIKELCGIENLNQFLKLQSEMQERYVRTMHEKGCSIRQLVRITGLTKARIERFLLWNKKKGKDK